jgi:hypothetical protein
VLGNFRPGVLSIKSKYNPARVRRERNPFRVDRPRYSFDPRVVAALQLWAEIS